MAATRNDPIFCSFCGKNRREVRGLIAGPKVYLCSECWELATDAFAEMAKCDPTVAYAVIKKERLDQQELFLRRQIAMCRTEQIIEIRGARPASEDIDELDDGPDAAPGDSMPSGGDAT